MALAVVSHKRLVLRRRPCFKPWRWPATAALAKDATGTELFRGDSPTSINWTGFTMGSVSNGALVFVFAATTLTEAGVTATWDNGGANQSMGLVKSQNASANGNVKIFGLVGPTAGNKTLAVAGITAATVDIYIDAISFSGVDQTGGATTFYGAIGANATSQFPNPGTTTTASGDATVDVGILTVGGDVTGSQGASQTVLFVDGAGAISEGWGSYNVGTAAPTFSWNTGGGGSVWCDAACSVKAAAAASAVFRRSLSPIGTRTGARQLVSQE